MTPTKVMLRAQIERLRALSPKERFSGSPRCRKTSSERFVKAYNKCNPLEWPES